MTQVKFLIRSSIWPSSFLCSTVFLILLCSVLDLSKSYFHWYVHSANIIHNFRRNEDFLDKQNLIKLINQQTCTIRNVTEIHYKCKCIDRLKVPEWKKIYTTQTLSKIKVIEAHKFQKKQILWQQVLLQKKKDISQ